MAYWLLKSEPETFGIDHLKAMKVEHWDGVRNYQARNNLMAMKVGEMAFFYHSNANPTGIVGVCEVVKEAYPDDSQFDPKSTYYDPKAAPEKPRWFMPDVGFVEKFDRMITLAELREIPGLQDMTLLGRARLSVQPVSDKQWEIIMQLAHGG